MKSDSTDAAAEADEGQDQDILDLIDALDPKIGAKDAFDSLSASVAVQKAAVARLRQ